MPPPKNTNDLIFERLAENLDSTSKLTHALLAEIRESEVDFATLKVELSSLRENVKSITSIISEGNGNGLITKMALIEQRISNIDKCIESSKSYDKNHEEQYSQLLSKGKDIESRINQIELYIKEQIEERRQKEKDLRASIVKDQELTVEIKKSGEKIKEERTKAMIQLAVAVTIAIVTFSFTTASKSCVYPQLQPPPAQSAQR